MPHVHLLLRFLLGLVLVLDGIGAAAAATQMRLQHAGVASITASGDTRAAADHADMAPCHEQGNGVAVDPAKPDDQAGHATPDCCASAQCHCPCAQPAPAAPVLAFACDAVVIHVAAERAPAAGYAAPTLPHLIRPPIG